MRRDVFPTRIVCAALIVLAIAPLFARRATAAESPTDADVTQNLAWIQSRFDAAEPRAELWWRSWLLFNSLMLVGNGVAAIGAPVEDERWARGVAGAMAGIGVVHLGITGPFVSHVAADRMRAWPESTPDERQRKLARAEDLLRRAAVGERKGIDWKNHVGCALLSAASGGILLARGQTMDAALQAAGSFAISEVMIYTQPRSAIHAWDEYSRGATTSTSSPMPTWNVLLTPSGVALAGTW
ncbi:MAG: hypothetical protein KJ042_16175 [Deltaproteobacteria bacterium]|nr:hypothetical protein [Deltaproteobacteria bacterium]